MVASTNRKERGAWCCPHGCKNQCATLWGINRHLERKHSGLGFGIYFTALELKARKSAKANSKGNENGI